MAISDHPAAVERKKGKPGCLGDLMGPVIREQQGRKVVAKKQTWREREGRSGRHGIQALGFSKSLGNIFCEEASIWGVVSVLK